MSATLILGEYGLKASGDLRIAPHAIVRCGIECDGDTTVGEGANVGGHVTVGGVLSVGAGARVDGAIRAEEGVDWHPSATSGALHTRGPLRLGGHVLARSVDVRREVAPFDGGS